MVAIARRNRNRRISSVRNRRQHRGNRAAEVGRRDNSIAVQGKSRKDCMIGINILKCIGQGWRYAHPIHKQRFQMIAIIRSDGVGN